MKVLIVDDSRTMRNFLAAIVRELAIEVDLASSGEQGLQRLDQSGPFVLALVDWNMPGMTGIAFIRKVREQQGLAGMKLMMVSGRTDQEAVVEAVSSGADDFLMKPLTPAMVADKFRILGLLE